VVSFYEAFSARECAPTHLSLFARTADPGDVLLGQDVIYVGGGSVANMLAVWRLHGVDAILREAWLRGIVLAGVSAGANCWFEDSTTDSFGPLRRTGDGLAFLPGSFCPHYDSEPGRRPLYVQLISEGLPGGYAVQDGAAVHFAGKELVGAVTCRPQAEAYRVERRNGEVDETPLPTQRL
jgi:peptidase E